MALLRFVDWREFCLSLLRIGFITRAIRKAYTTPPEEQATVIDKDVQLEQARALAELMKSPVKHWGKEKERFARP